MKNKTDKCLEYALVIFLLIYNERKSIKNKHKYHLIFCSFWDILFSYNKNL